MDIKWERQYHTDEPRDQQAELHWPFWAEAGPGREAHSWWFTIYNSAEQNVIAAQGFRPGEDSAKETVAEWVRLHPPSQSKAACGHSLARCRTDTCFHPGEEVEVEHGHVISDFSGRIESFRTLPDGALQVKVTVPSEGISEFVRVGREELATLAAASDQAAKRYEAGRPPSVSPRRGPYPWESAREARTCRCGGVLEHRAGCKS